MCACAVLPVRMATILISDVSSVIEFRDFQIAWVFTDTDLEHLLFDLRGEVTFDLETTGLKEHAAHSAIVTAQFTTTRRTWVVPLWHPESPFQGRWKAVITRIAQTLVDNNCGLIGHNIKFDLRWMYRHTRIDMASQVVWDTMSSSHLLDENRSARLKDVVPRTFPAIERWDDDMNFSVTSAQEQPLFTLGAYGARDTFWTQQLADNHRHRMFLTDDVDEPFGADEVDDARLGHLMEQVTLPTVKTLTRIEQRGIGLDEAWAEAELISHEAQALALTESLARRYDVVDPDKPSFAPTSHWFRDWTQAAVEAGDLVVAELTPTGKPRWNKEVLVRQARGGSDVAIDLLAQRSHMKKAEFLRSWLTEEPRGAIHSSYNSSTVVTGRLSSSSPNMQQVTKQLRKAFIPRPGYVLADLDYSQIELRVAAFVSRSQPMLDAFRRGDDLHNLLAAKITGKQPDQVTPEERQAGKSANFGLLYGMGAYGFRMYSEAVYGVTFSRDEAVTIHRAFFDVWTGMREWHARSAKVAHDTGQVKSPIGRVRRLPDITDGNEERVMAAERAAINAPVQGFASDLMQIAAASIEGMIPGHQPVEGARIVATVHDSIVVEVAADDWETITRRCIERMVKVTEVVKRLGCDLDVPLTVGATVGTRWGLSDVGEL